MVFQKNYIESLVGTAKPDTPQFLLKNPQKKQLWVNSIELTPDSFFARKGKIVIKINGDFILAESEVGTFQSYKLFHVPLDKQELFKQKKIEIFVWNGIDDDEVQISANVLISEEFSNIPLAGVPTDTETLNRDISDSYIDRPIQFLSDTLSGKLDSVKSSVDSEKTDLLVKLQALINSLPDSPANADIIAKLAGVISSVDSEKTDLLVKLQSLIESLPASPDNVGIRTKLQNIVNFISNTNTLTLVALLGKIQSAINASGAGAYRTALNSIKTDLEGLKNGFDIDELTDTIDTMQNNIATIRNNNPSLGNDIDVFKVALEQILINAKLNKSKKGILIPKRVYYNSSTPVLFNTKGYKNIIVTMAGSTIPDLIAYSDIPQTLNIGEHTFSTVNTWINNVLSSSFPIYSSHPGFSPSSYFAPIRNNVATYANLIQSKTMLTVYDMKEIGLHILEFYFSASPYLTNGNKVIRNTNQQARRIFSYMRKKYFIRIEESNSPTSGYTLVSNFIASNSSATKTYSGITKRYVRIRIVIRVYLWIEVGGSNYHFTQPMSCAFGAMSENINKNTMFSNVVDRRKKGGTAYLSIEIKDAFDEWFTLVSSNELGTITGGTRTIKSFGEALGNKALPATQDSLRFVLTVIGGGIETGVSVMRVA